MSRARMLARQVSVLALAIGAALVAPPAQGNAAPAPGHATPTATPTPHPSPPAKPGPSATTTAPHRDGAPYGTMPVGDHLVTLGTGRQYVLHAPPAQEGRTWPLVVVLHGVFNSWSDIAHDGDWSAFADRHHFVVAYGIGLHGSWNAGSCCGYASASGVDDTSYLVSVVRDVEARWALIDRRRVYAVGFSTGDMMALRAVCDRPDIFAAGGGTGGDLMTSCHSPTPVRFREMHGASDNTVPVAGGVRRIAGRPVAVAPLRALPTRIAATSPRPVVEITTFPGAGHAWPRLDNAFHTDGTALVWAWISRYSTPPPPPALVWWQHLPMQLWVMLDRR